MTTSRMTVRVLAALTLVAGFTAAAHAQPPAVTAEWALKQQPRQPGVNVTTPTPDQAPRCTVAPIPNPKGGQPVGYIVRDGNNQPVRTFVSVDGKTFNIIAFYVDGAEAYRETYPPQGANQFRWLGPNGTKWGIDHDRDGRIDEWAVISPEEVSQELFAAVMTRDEKRLQTLMVTKEQLGAIGLPAADAEKLKARGANVAKRLTDTADSLKLSAKAKWMHVEYGIPSTRAADSFEGKEDFTSYKSGTILIDDAGKPHTLQTGELVQVGRAWKLIDGLSPSGGEVQLVLPQIEALVRKLNEIEKQAPNPATPAALAAFNAKRAEVLEQVVGAVPDDKLEAKETWAKMLIDAHAAAAEGGKPGNAHLARVQQWRDVMAKTGNTTLAGYAAFRFLFAENNVTLVNSPPEQYVAIQEKWRSNLEEFIKTYGKSPDAPEAALRLAMAWELAGGKDAAELKANEAKARQWYDHIAKTHADHPHAAKAKGALKRFDSEGQPLELTGPQLGTNQLVTAAQKDKAVVVYYWASWSQSLADDAKKLDALVKTYGPKGLVLVTVSLDSDAKAAADAVKAAGLPGTHLHTPNTPDGNPLAAVYGIAAPPHILVAGKDGKVTNRGGQITTLEDDVKKALGEK